MQEKTTKEYALSLHRNGASAELICNSLNLTQKELEDILKG